MFVLPIADFVCKCGRVQRYAHENEPGGCTVEEAEAIGWRQIDGKWVCPFCCGNTSALRKIFEKNPPSGTVGETR
jgi:hypothetical protein